MNIQSIANKGIAGAKAMSHTNHHFLKIQSNSAPFKMNRPVKLNVDVIQGQNQEEEDKHVIFLHGLFGKSQSFQFLAKARDI